MIGFIESDTFGRLTNLQSRILVILKQSHIDYSRILRPEPKFKSV